MSTTRTQIEDKIYYIVATILSRDNVDDSNVRTANFREKYPPSASLTNDMGADSLDLVEIIIEVERHYGIDVHNKDADAMNTINDIVDYLERTHKVN